MTMARPTRRTTLRRAYLEEHGGAVGTMETVKSAERLMEALDEVREASAEEGDAEEKKSSPQESIKVSVLM